MSRDINILWMRKETLCDMLGDVSERLAVAEKIGPDMAEENAILDKLATKRAEELDFLKAILRVMRDGAQQPNRTPIAGDKIRIIMAMRAVRDFGLKEAKDWLEAL
jgi:hypothetical protein